MKKTTKKPVQNKAEKIRALLAEGIPVEDIAQQVGVKQPYVIQVRWHWRGGKKKSSKAKKAKDKPVTVEQMRKDVAAIAEDSAAQKIDWKGNDWVVEINDPVNHPDHYKVGGIETIDFIEAKGLGYNLGNVVKYITRADHKGHREQDLNKALWYLSREIDKFREF